MNIKDLVPVDYSNQRVLTTAQLAEIYDTTPYRIRDNFHYAKEQFQEGVHYFKVTGEELRALKGKLSDVGNSYAATKESGREVRNSYSPSPIPKTANLAILWTHEGCVRHCKMLNTQKALERFAELECDYFQIVKVKIGDKPDVPQIVTVEGVSGYIDDKGVAWLSAKDIARECGWTKEQRPVSGHISSSILQTKEKPPESGGTSFSIRWRRINDYLRELGYDKEVGRGDFLPENVFYRLIWKSRSEYAKKFQSKIADVILPAIRKNGYYISEQAAQGSLFHDEEPVKENHPAPPVVDDELEVLKMENARLRNQIPQNVCLKLAVVYVLLMSNGTVKIGYTTNPTERFGKIKSETGLYILNFYSSRLMSIEDARALEAALKEKFAAYCIGGEYFDVKFSLVCAEF